MPPKRKRQAGTTGNSKTKKGKRHVSQDVHASIQIPEEPMVNNKAILDADPRVSPLPLQFPAQDMIPCAGDDIASHVPMQLRQKIWEHQYINLNLLLKGSAELREFYTTSNLVINDSGLIESRPKVMKEKISNIDKWTDAFILFMHVYLQRYPNRALELTQYIAIIRDAAKRTGGLGWRDYDEQFRLRQAINYRPWSQLNSDLWLRLISVPLRPSPTSNDQGNRDVVRTMHRLIALSISQSTKAAYKTAINQFRKFRAMAALGDLWPAPLDHIMLFIAYLSRQSRTASTISSYMAALSFIHKINNWSDPSHTFLVTKALEGMKRLRPQKDCRAPITIELLQKIYCELPNVCLSYYEVLLFRSAYTLAFLAYLGQGRSMLTVQLRFSKTDQRGKSCRIHLAELRNNPICPVSNVRDSIIYWAHRSALRLLNRHLRLEQQGVHINWMGKRVQRILILHVGGNDLIDYTTSMLCAKIEYDISILAQWLPNTIIIWSDILPRLYWRGSLNIKAIEKKRKRVNRSGRRSAFLVGGRVIHHQDITYVCPSLFRADKVHLTDVGNALFLNNLQNELELCASNSFSMS
ncbi:hypothetical protein KUTeg_001601 [Tegillarca granosa]|uniref:Core-binding (CB) domain-containing protein n=1 Tax=Tegillarca granosa TaxID=220873 RepID=A0ABQ9FRW8_TEGGR|nr:hypothetical protein KUTeg_001601 [Tegillarca granosa]